MGIRRSRAIAAVLLTIGAATFATAGQAHACSCVGPGKDGWAGTFKDADGALIAKLIDKRPIGDGLHRFRTRYVYELVEVFKKRDRFEPGQIRRIVAPTDGASCGIERPVGATHALFVNRLRGRWTSNLCLSLLGKSEMRDAAAGRPVTSALPRTRTGANGWPKRSSASSSSAIATSAGPTTRTSKLCSSTAL